MKTLIASTLTLLLLAGCGAPARPGAAAVVQPSGMSRSEALSFKEAFDPKAGNAWEREAAALEARLPRGLDVRSPAAHGVTFSAALPLDLRFRHARALTEAFEVHLDGEDITARLKPGALKHQWVGRVEGLAPGRHRLTLLHRDSLKTAHEVTFQHRTQAHRDRLVALADATVGRFDPREMGWDWGEGLLTYALARLDQHLGETRYRPFIEDYYGHHLAKGLPRIDWSDKCAPALAAFELYRETGDPKYARIAEAVADYLKTAEPTPEGGLNHLGFWWPSKLYPTSMWVDSLMMYNVFAARWGAHTGDAALTEFAATQPLHFAKALQHPGTKLWKHAYFSRFKGALPTGDTYWLRGNGWALASMPETLEALPQGHPARAELVSRYRDHAAALLPFQSESGLWYTVLNQPGKTYLESSGTALMALGMLKGVHAGHLGPEYREPALRAYTALLDRLEQKPDGVSMPEISHNTMPYTFLGYKLVPQRNDLAFGLAAMILAGIEYDREVAR